MFTRVMAEGLQRIPRAYMQISSSYTWEIQDSVILEVLKA